MMKISMISILKLNSDIIKTRMMMVTLTIKELASTETIKTSK
jgi:hypothetical protein